MGMSEDESGVRLCQFLVRATPVECCMATRNASRIRYLRLSTARPSNLRLGPPKVGHRSTLILPIDAEEWNRKPIIQSALIGSSGAYWRFLFDREVLIWVERRSG